jgi:glycine oxidase
LFEFWGDLVVALVSFSKTVYLKNILSFLRVMVTNKRVDFLIIGQGLAGSCLTLQLWKKRKDVFVIDHPNPNSASIVAAGLFNPVTGKLMTKTWMADQLFSYLHTFYRESEQILNERFFYPIPLYRPFLSVEEQNEWMGKSSGTAMEQYIDQVFSHSQFDNEVTNPFGGLLLKNCGYVDTNGLIDMVRSTLIEKGCFECETFNENELEALENSVRYKGIEANKIIYCNGIDSLKSRFFRQLPIRPLKGEALLIRLDQTLKRIYNRGVYVVPTNSEGVYKVGATYNAKDKSEGSTEEGKEELIERLSALIRVPFEILKQEWGLRPTSIDRKPIIGSLPTHPNVVIFNGLGTKGVSLAPFFSNQLVNWLIKEGQIESSVNVNRFS